MKEFNWTQRRTYVANLVDSVAPKNKKNQVNETSRRSNTFFCFLKRDGVRVRVCTKMFINTLCIGTLTLHNWAMHKADVRPTKLDKSINKKDAIKKKGLQQFFSLLPKMESHYWRASSSKLNLEPIWQSKSALYKEYAKYCKDSDLQI